MMEFFDHARLSRRSLGLLAAGAAMGPVAFGATAAEQRAVALPRMKIVIPANVGGGWDRTGRSLGAALVASGAVQEVAYENFGGKGGILGLSKFAAQYGADPEALLIGGMVMTGAVALHKPTVTLANVQPLARLTSEYEVVAVPAESAIKNSRSLMEQLKLEPKAVVFAGGSAGGVDHIFAGMLARLARQTQNLAYLPHASGSDVVDALMKGRAAVGISGYSEFRESLASGHLRAIGVSSRRAFQGIPSLRDQGVDADLENWRGAFVGKAVPAERRKAMLDAVRRATTSDAWKKSLVENFWEATWMDGPSFESFLELDQAMAGVLVMLLKLQPA